MAHRYYFIVFRVQLERYPHVKYTRKQQIYNTTHAARGIEKPRGPVYRTSGDCLGDKLCPSENIE